MILLEVYHRNKIKSIYLKDIISAHEEIRNSENGYTNMVDACTILRKLDKDVYLVPGNRGNIKITTPEDVYVFKAFLQYKENEQTFGLGLTNKIGTQYDTVKSSNKYNS